MDPSFNKDNINKRLDLYFEYSDLIEEVEKANSQFEADFDELSDYLIQSWEERIQQQYDFEDSGWTTSSSSNPKWQKIYPDYWHQNPRDISSSIHLYFRHSPTTEGLRDRQLSFRLRLPPQRIIHTKAYEGDKSFNSTFISECSNEYRDAIEEALEGLEVDEIRLHSASSLFVKHYNLESPNLTDSYYEKLEQACDEFCMNEDLLDEVNDAFEDAYREVFGESPEGVRPDTL